MKYTQIWFKELPHFTGFSKNIHALLAFPKIFTPYLIFQKHLVLRGKSVHLRTVWKMLLRKSVA